MTAPSTKVREATYKRDGYRCVSCGRRDGLQWNHRESSGAGGRGSKAPVLTPADGITSCWECNPAYEGRLQSKALANGWKIRRNRVMASHEIPFYDAVIGGWFLPDVEGRARSIPEGSRG